MCFRRAIRCAPCLAGLLLAAAVASPAAGGAWTLREGEGLAIVSLTTTEAERGFGAAATGGPVPDLRKAEVALLLELGLDDDTTLIARPQYQSIELGPPLLAYRYGPGHTEIGLRRRLWADDRAVLSGQFLLRVPGARDDTNPAAAGATDPEFDLRALVGRSFMLFERPAFADMQFAYRARPGDPPGETHVDLTLGIRPQERLLLLAQSFNVVSDGSAAGGLSETRHHKLQLSAVWEFAEGWSVQLGGVATVAGRDALRERGVIAALWRRF